MNGAVSTVIVVIVIVICLAAGVWVWWIENGPAPKDKKDGEDSADEKTDADGDKMI